MTSLQTNSNRRPLRQALLVVAAGLLVSLALVSFPIDEAFGTEGASSAASAGEVSNIVDELSQEIESPYCPGKTLSMCPSGGASKVRREMQEMARHGKSKQQIKEAILERHGDELRLREPPAEDHYPLIGLIIVGLVGCVFAVRYFARGSAPGATTGSPPEPDDQEWSERDDIYLQEIREKYEE